jgi:hypothetical protein
MKERFLIHLGDAEILAIIVRNGLFASSWRNMRSDMLSGSLFLPGISVHTVETLNIYEKRYGVNLDSLLFHQILGTHRSYGRYLNREQQDDIQKICYTICRGIFSYPCVADENRINAAQADSHVGRTYLARPVLCGDTLESYPVYKGVHRMFPNPEEIPHTPMVPDHDHMLDQLNKIRECFPCHDKATCNDYQYVAEATKAVIQEYQLENSFLGKILARSLCWMTAEESRLMRLIEKEGLLMEPQDIFQSGSDNLDSDEFFTDQDADHGFNENNPQDNIPYEPNPLLDVLHDLRESIRDTVRLLCQLKDREAKTKNP